MIVSARAFSSDQMYFWVGVQSVPPYFAGQDGTDQPFFTEHLVPGQKVVAAQVFALTFSGQLLRIIFLR